jgi:hypothetical protein
MLSLLVCPACYCVQFHWWLPTCDSSTSGLGPNTVVTYLKRLVSTFEGSSRPNLVFRATSVFPSPRCKFQIENFCD